MSFLSIDQIENKEYLDKQEEIFSSGPFWPFWDLTKEFMRNPTNGKKIVGGNLLTQVCDFCNTDDHEKCRKSYKDFFDFYMEEGAHDNFLFAKMVKSYYMHTSHNPGNKLYGKYHDDEHYFECCKEYNKAKQKISSRVDGECPYKKIFNQLKN